MRLPHNFISPKGVVSLLFLHDHDLAVTAASRQPEPVLVGPPLNGVNYGLRIERNALGLLEAARPLSCPDFDLLVVGTGSQDRPEPGMGPGHGPHWGVVPIIIIIVFVIVIIILLVLLCLNTL